MTFPFSALPKKTLCAIAWCRISFGRMKKRPQQNNPYRKDFSIWEKIRVIITNNQKAVKVPTGVRMLIRRCCHAVLRMEKFEDSAEISVTFVDNEQIRELNAQYRNKDAATDVLSFPMGENGVYDINHDTGAKILGDIVLSVEMAMAQAKRYGHSLEREIGYLTAHSMLHLLGYDHENGGMERVRMREKEEYVMSQLGLPGTSSYTV
mgnify:CR=1 FL=1